MGSEIRFCGPASQTNHLNIQDHRKGAQGGHLEPLEGSPNSTFLLSSNPLTPLHPCFHLISVCQNSQFQYPPKMLLSFKHLAPSWLTMVNPERNHNCSLAQRFRVPIGVSMKNAFSRQFYQLNPGCWGTMPPWSTPPTSI